jgi:hypothetical protein
MPERIDYLLDERDRLTRLLEADGCTVPDAGYSTIGEPCAEIVYEFGDGSRFQIALTMLGES